MKKGKFYELCKAIFLILRRRFIINKAQYNKAVQNIDSAMEKEVESIMDENESSMISKSSSSISAAGDDLESQYFKNRGMS